MAAICPVIFEELELLMRLVTRTRHERGEPSIRARFMQRTASKQARKQGTSLASYLLDACPDKIGEMIMDTNMGMDMEMNTKLGRYSNATKQEKEGRMRKTRRKRKMRSERSAQGCYYHVRTMF